MTLTLDPTKYGLDAGCITGWKSFQAEKMESNQPSRSVISFISTNSVDEEGDVVLPEGIDVSRFKKSGTVFWNHNYDRPCGVCDSLERRDGGVVARTRFPERPKGHEGTWLADDAWALFSSDPPIVRSFSIGFAYMETRPPTTKDLERFGGGARQVVSKSRLLEYSVAPLPMNENALTLAVQKGVISPGVPLRIYGKTITPRRRLEVKTSPAPDPVRLVIATHEPGPDITVITTDAVERARGRVFVV